MTVICERRTSPPKYKDCAIQEQVKLLEIITFIDLQLIFEDKVELGMCMWPVLSAGGQKQKFLIPGYAVLCRNYEIAEL